jgi:hypothetical protein
LIEICRPCGTRFDLNREPTDKSVGYCRSSCGLFLAPVARQKIARRFNGGIRWRLETSPVRDDRETISNFLSFCGLLIA